MKGKQVEAALCTKVVLIMLVDQGNSYVGLPALNCLISISHFPHLTITYLIQKHFTVLRRDDSLSLNPNGLVKGIYPPVDMN